MREDRRYGYTLLAGFSMLLFAGLMVAGFGLEYSTGSTIETIGSVSTIQNNYSSIDAIERTIVSLPLVLTGFWGVLVAVSGIRSSTDEEDDE